MDLTFQSVRKLLVEVGLGPHEEVTLPGRPAKLLPIPPNLSATAQVAIEKVAQSGLFAHQAEAIQAASQKKNICLATPTASGKSLVFMATAIDVVTQTVMHKVLALYPARALIQDQLQKWRALVGHLGIRVANIDGGVPTKDRETILKQNQVILMTPDVVHAWLMSHLGQETIRNFLRLSLRLLILDEAHVYEGAFGTNMAYLLRRLRAASGIRQVIASTATLGDPGGFLRALTGLEFQVFGPESDGGPSPEKQVILVQPGTKPLEAAVGFLSRCCQAKDGRFLAFGDSRKMVEQVVALVQREISSAEETPDSQDIEAPPKSEAVSRILPYRAGYETVDRERIQSALAGGGLTGVVSTSALELGLDIGDIDLIVLLTTSPSVKSFWQRLGRGGRRRPGVCVVFDSRGTIAKKGLKDYMRRPLERNWLYLENRYLQFTNVLCAAAELTGSDFNLLASFFGDVPPSFLRFLENEINPTEVVPDELYPLKQRGQDSPHYEFPLRSSIEPNFQVLLSEDERLGSLSWPQVLREAYPGAIHFYMARPHRVVRHDRLRKEIRVSRRDARGFTTQPLSQTKVFPRFPGGILWLATSDRGYLAEAELQVSERVQGFLETRGSVKNEHRYGLGSPYSQRDLNRTFPTTGACWSFNGGIGRSEVTAAYILDAFALEFGIQSRDLGIGSVFAKDTPGGRGEADGMCIYDETHGSLRLTEQLTKNFVRVTELAIELAAREEDKVAVPQLRLLAERAQELTLEEPFETHKVPELGEDWVEVIAPGEKAVFVDTQETTEVDVIEHVYTPKGLMYKVDHEGEVMQISSGNLLPIPGHTKIIRVNLVTGQSEE